MDITRLFDFAYLVEKNPDPVTAMTLPMATLFMLIIAICLLINIATDLNMFHPVTRGLLRKFPGSMYTFAIIGLILLIARHEGSPFLSMRILMVLNLLMILGYVLWRAYEFSQEYPRRMQTYKSKKTVSL